MPKRRHILWMLCCSYFIGFVSFTAAADYSLGGYVKSYFYLFLPPAVDGPGGTVSDPAPEAIWSNRFRIQASYRPAGPVRLEGAYDLGPWIRSRDLSGDGLFFRQIDPFSYRAVDLEADIFSSANRMKGRFMLGHNLDRASVTLSFPQADLTIGRQAIAWGNARILNPTDVLAPFAFETLDSEDRIGIDAVRARVPIGTLSEIDLGYVFGENFRFDTSAFFARTILHASRTDISLLFMGFRENLLLGFDLARPVGGAGYWLETAYVFSGFFGDEHARTGENYFRATAGADYNLSAKVYGFAEYHFNGAGGAQPGDYPGLASQTAYTEGSVYLAGRHYLVPGLVYQWHPLSSFSVQSLINLADRSLFLSPQMDYNITNNTHISAGAFVAIGRGPVVSGQEPAIEPGSEFGAHPNICFASLRYYF